MEGIMLKIQRLDKSEMKELMSGDRKSDPRWAIIKGKFVNHFMRYAKLRILSKLVYFYLDFCVLKLL